MKYIVATWLFRIISILSFIWVLGTAGAFEHDLIDWVQCLARCAVCLVVGIVSLILAVRIEHTYN